jgi:hypothetical protein
VRRITLLPALHAARMPRCRTTALPGGIGIFKPGQSLWGNRKITEIAFGSWRRALYCLGE